jgi:hypothetical protein
METAPLQFRHFIFFFELISIAERRGGHFLEKGSLE